MNEVLAAQGISQTFGDVQALRDVSFRFGGPQLVAILGPNGAGKTTLLDILEGLREPTRGELRLFGEPVRRYPRRRVGVVLQKEFTLDSVTTGEYAELFAAIYDVRDGAGAILRTARLAHRARVSVARLSGGEAQRLFIAAAQVHDPELLFLDEPTARLDPEARRELGVWLRETSRHRTVVMTTHDLREADKVCDSALFLVDGAIRAQGTRTELLKATPNGETNGLEAAFFHFCSVRIDATGDATSLVRAPMASDMGDAR